MNGNTDTKTFDIVSIYFCLVGVIRLPLLLFLVVVYGPIMFLRLLIRDTNSDLLTRESRFADNDIFF